MSRFLQQLREKAEREATEGTRVDFTLPSVLSIAGSDSSGGAGIQADIKTIQALGLFAQTAITAITAQNTRGVRAVQNVDAEVVQAQIDAVFEDIRPDAVKVGMVSSPEIVGAIACALKRNGARNVVVDPVLVATSGSALASDGVVASLKSELLPLATIVTPNLAEAEALSGISIATAADAEAAARVIARDCLGAVLIKGGHGLCGPERPASEQDKAADDLLLMPTGEVIWFYGDRIDNPNTHGTGCTLSSAIASRLAIGHDVAQCVGAAKAYLTGALQAQLNLGAGSGPLDHFWNMRNNR